MTQLTAIAAALVAGTAATPNDDAVVYSTPDDIQQWRASLRTGMSAVRALGNTIDQHAAGMSISGEELARTLRGDLSLAVDREGNIVAFCPEAPEPAPTPETIPEPGDFPLSDAFTLNSRPGAKKTIYLDFDGYFSTGNAWGHTIDFPSYNTSGSSNNFSNGELNEIIGQWLQVAEDFAPFDVNVTTQDPGVEALRKSDPNDDEFGIRVVMTQQTNGFGNGTGGIAFLGSFRSNIDTPCFAFNKGILNGAMTASHEAGHAFGLVHDGLFGSTYHPGSNESGSTGWGPVMGAPFGRNLTQWSNGDYPGATSAQLDLNAIASPAPFNDVSYIPDDHPDDLGWTELANGVPVGGVLAGNADNDIDGFVFNSACGDATVSIRVLDEASNADLAFDLFGVSNGSYLGYFEQTGSLDKDFELELDRGSYLLLLRGSHTPRTNGPVSGYGSMGQYEITVTSPGGCCPADVNNDGTASPSDFTAWLSCFNNPNDPGCDAADINLDGSIGPADFTAWLAAFSQGCN